MTPIRIGIFGLGRGASFINIIKSCGGEIVAVCEKDEKRTKKALEKIGSPDGVTCYTDPDRFIEHDMDAVFLANFFHEHAKYAIRALERGVHVLSECISNGTMAEGVALVRAAEKSSAIYMLAENYPYMKFNKEMKRVYSGGTLGKALFAEGEYCHPVGPEDDNFTLTYRPYEMHWRHFLPRSYYITHSLAPLMHITGARPKRVTAFPVYAPLEEEYPTGTRVGDRAAVITCLNDDDSVFRVTGCAAWGAHGNSYRVCCTKGQIENIRGGDGKVMLRYNDWDVPEGMEKVNYYMPEWNDPDAEKIAQSGHGGGDYLVIRNFFNCIRTGEKTDFDVYFATTTAAVAIQAHRSVMSGGMPMDIPDFHLEEDRVKFENDWDTPFPDLDGNGATVPCCSRPDYLPSESQLERYRKVISKA